MADYYGESQASIALLFTVMGGSSLTGDTGKRIANDLNNIIVNYNHSGNKTKVKVDIDLNDFARKLKSLTGLMAGTLDITPKYDQKTSQAIYRAQTNEIEKAQEYQEDFTKDIEKSTESIRDLAKQYGVLGRVVARNEKSNNNSTQGVVAAANKERDRIIERRDKILNSGDYSESQKESLENEWYMIVNKETSMTKRGNVRDFDGYQKYLHTAFQVAMSKTYAKNSAGDEAALLNDVSNTLESTLNHLSKGEFSDAVVEEMNTIVSTFTHVEDFQNRAIDDQKKDVSTTKGLKEQVDGELEKLKSQAEHSHSQVIDDETARAEVHKRSDEANDFLKKYKREDFFDEETIKYLDKEIDDREEINSLIEEERRNAEKLRQANEEDDQYMADILRDRSEETVGALNEKMKSMGLKEVVTLDLVVNDNAETFSYDDLRGDEMNSMARIAGDVWDIYEEATNKIKAGETVNLDDEILSPIKEFIEKHSSGSPEFKAELDNLYRDYENAVSAIYENRDNLYETLIYGAKIERTDPQVENNSLEPETLRAHTEEIEEDTDNLLKHTDVVQEDAEATKKHNEIVEEERKRITELNDAQKNDFDKAYVKRAKEFRDEMDGIPTFNDLVDFMGGTKESIASVNDFGENYSGVFDAIADSVQENAIKIENAYEKIGDPGRIIEGKNGKKYKNTDALISQSGNFSKVSSGLGNGFKIAENAAGVSSRTPESNSLYRVYSTEHELVELKKEEEAVQKAINRSTEDQSGAIKNLRGRLETITQTYIDRIYGGEKITSDDLAASMTSDFNKAYAEETKNLSEKGTSFDMGEMALRDMLKTRISILKFNSDVLKSDETIEAEEKGVADQVQHQAEQAARIREDKERAAKAAAAQAESEKQNTKVTQQQAVASEEAAGAARQSAGQPGSGAPTAKEKVDVKQIGERAAFSAQETEERLKASGNEAVTDTIQMIDAAVEDYATCVVQYFKDGIEGYPQNVGKIKKDIFTVTKNSIWENDQYSESFEKQNETRKLLYSIESSREEDARFNAVTQQMDLLETKLTGTSLNILLALREAVEDTFSDYVQEIKSDANHLKDEPSAKIASRTHGIDLERLSRKSESDDMLAESAKKEMTLTGEINELTGQRIAKEKELKQLHESINVEGHQTTADEQEHLRTLNGEIGSINKIIISKEKELETVKNEGLEYAGDVEMRSSLLNIAKSYLSSGIKIIGYNKDLIVQDKEREKSAERIAQSKKEGEKASQAELSLIEKIRVAELGRNVRKGKVYEKDENGAYNGKLTGSVPAEYSHILEEIEKFSQTLPVSIGMVYNAVVSAINSETQGVTRQILLDYASAEKDVYDAMQEYQSKTGKKLPVEQEGLSDLYPFISHDVNPQPTNSRAIDSYADELRIYQAYQEQTKKNLDIINDRYEKQEAKVDKLNRDLEYQTDLIAKIPEGDSTREALIQEREKTRMDLTKAQNEFNQTVIASREAEQELKFADDAVEGTKKVIRQKIIEAETYRKLANDIENYINEGEKSVKMDAFFRTQISTASISDMEKQSLSKLLEKGSPMLGSDNRLEDAIRSAGENAMTLRANGIEKWYEGTKVQIKDLATNIVDLDKAAQNSTGIKSLFLYTANDFKTLGKIGTSVSNITESIKVSSISDDVARGITASFTDADKIMKNSLEDVKKLDGELAHLKTQGQAINIEGYAPSLMRELRAEEKVSYRKNEQNVNSALGNARNVYSSVMNGSVPDKAVSAWDIQSLEESVKGLGIACPPAEEQLKKLEKRAKEGTLYWAQMGSELEKLETTLLFKNNDVGAGGVILTNLQTIQGFLSGEELSVDDLAKVNNLINETIKKIDDFETKMKDPSARNEAEELKSSLRGIGTEVASISATRGNVATAANKILDASEKIRRLPSMNPEYEKEVDSLAEEARLISESDKIVVTRDDGSDAMINMARKVEGAAQGADIYERTMVNDFVDGAQRMGSSWDVLSDKIGKDGGEIGGRMLQLQKDLKTSMTDLSVKNVLKTDDLSIEYANDQYKPAIDLIEQTKNSVLNRFKNFSIYGNDDDLKNIIADIETLNVVIDDMSKAGVFADTGVGTRNFIRGMFGDNETGLMKYVQDLISADAAMVKFQNDAEDLEVTQMAMFDPNDEIAKAKSGAEGINSAINGAAGSASKFTTILDGVGGKFALVLDDSKGINSELVAWAKNTNLTKHSYEGLEKLQEQIFAALRAANNSQGENTKQYYNTLANLLQERYKDIYAEMTPGAEKISTNDNPLFKNGEREKLDANWNLLSGEFLNKKADKDVQQFESDLARLLPMIDKYIKVYKNLREAQGDKGKTDTLTLRANAQEAAINRVIMRLKEMEINLGKDNPMFGEALSIYGQGTTVDTFKDELENRKKQVDEEIRSNAELKRQEETDAKIKEVTGDILKTWNELLDAQKRYIENPNLKNDAAVQTLRVSLKKQIEHVEMEDDLYNAMTSSQQKEWDTITDVINNDKKLESEDIKRAKTLKNVVDVVNEYKQACRDLLKYSGNPESKQYKNAHGAVDRIGNVRNRKNGIAGVTRTAVNEGVLSEDERTVILEETKDLRKRTEEQISYNKAQRDEANARAKSRKEISGYNAQIRSLISERERLDKIENRYGNNQYTKQLEDKYAERDATIRENLDTAKNNGTISGTEYDSLINTLNDGIEKSALFAKAQGGNARALKGVGGAVKGVTNAYKEEEDIIKRYFDSYTALMKNEKNGQTVSQKTVAIYNDAKIAYEALRAEMTEKNVLSQEEITYLDGVIKKYEERMEVLNETKDFNENEAIAREEASWAKLQAKIASLVDQRKDLRFFNKDAARTIDYLDRIAHISFKDLQVGRFTNEILGIIDKDFGGRDKNKGIIQDIDNLIRGGLTDESLTQFDEKYGVSKRRSGQGAVAALGQEKTKEIYSAAAQSVVDLRDKFQECIDTEEIFNAEMANPIDTTYYNGLKESLGGVIDEGGELSNMFKELDVAMSSENPARAAENVVQRYQGTIDEARRIADLRDTMYNQLTAGNLNPETFGAIKAQFADLDNNEVAQNFIRAFEDFYNKNGYVNGEDEAIVNAFASTKAQWELTKGNQSRFFVKFEEEDYEQIKEQLNGIGGESEKVQDVLRQLEKQKGMPVASEGFREAQAALAGLLNEGSGIKDFINNLYAGANTPFSMENFNELGEKVESLEKIFPGVREAYDQMKAKIEEPITLDVFDQVVGGIDTTTEEGQKLKEQIMALRGDFEGGTYNLTNLSSLANMFEADTDEAKIATQAVELFNKALNPDLSTMIDARKYMLDVSTAGSTELANLAHEMDNFTNKTKRAFGTNLVQRASSMLTRSLMRPIRQIWTNIKGLESSLAQLEIVSKDASIWSQKFCDTISASAIKTATSVTTMVDSVTEYARLGYSVSEAATFAELTAEYSKIANTDVSTATTNITGIIKAFDISVNDLERALDELIRVGNNFAISSAELGEGLNNAAAALVANGNTLEQSLGMLAAANATVQDVSRASTAVRTVAARVSNSTSELEELGEDTSEIISTANLAAQMKTFGIAIQDVNGNLYSTYDILDQVAEKWDTYSNTAQASIAALLAGTRQQAVFYSMIQNWDDAKEAVEECGDAGGELSDSYGIYIDTIEGRLAQLSATWEQFSENILGSDLIKGAVNWINKILGAINKMVPAIKSMGTVFAALFAIIGNAIANRITKQVQKAKAGVQGLNAALQKTGTDASLGTKGITGTEGAGSGMQLKPRQQRRQQRLDRPGFGQNIRMAFGGGKGYRFNNSTGTFSVKNEAKIGNLEYEINKQDKHEARANAYEIEKTNALSRTENSKDREAIEAYYDDLIAYERSYRAEYEKKLEAERAKQGEKTNGGAKKKKIKMQEENPEKDAEQQPVGEGENNAASENPTPIENETEQTEELKEAANSATPPVTQLAESIDEVDANARSAAEGEGELGREIEATGEDVEKAGEDVGGFGDGTANAFGKQTKKAEKNTEKLDDEIQEMNDDAQKTGEEMPEAAEGIDQVNEAAKKSNGSHFNGMYNSILILVEIVASLVQMIGSATDSEQWTSFATAALIAGGIIVVVINMIRKAADGLSKNAIIAILTLVITLVSTIINLVGNWETKQQRAARKNREALEADLELLQEYKDSLEELTDDYDDLNDRIDELQYKAANGTITAAEDAELTRSLEQANIDEQKIQTKQTKVDETQEKVTEEAKTATENMTTVTYSYRQFFKAVTGTARGGGKSEKFLDTLKKENKEAGYKIYDTDNMTEEEWLVAMASHYDILDSEEKELFEKEIEAIQTNAENLYHTQEEIDAETDEAKKAQMKEDNESYKASRKILDEVALAMNNTTEAWESTFQNIIGRDMYTQAREFIEAISSLELSVENEIEEFEKMLQDTTDDELAAMLEKQGKTEQEIADDIAYISELRTALEELTSEEIEVAAGALGMDVDDFAKVMNRLSTDDLDKIVQAFNDIGEDGDRIATILKGIDNDNVAKLASDFGYTIEETMAIIDDAVNNIQNYEGISDLIEYLQDLGMIGDVSESTLKYEARVTVAEESEAAYNDYLESYLADWDAKAGDMIRNGTYTTSEMKIDREFEISELQKKYDAYLENAAEELYQQWLAEGRTEEGVWELLEREVMSYQGGSITGNVYKASYSAMLSDMDEAFDALSSALDDISDMGIVSSDTIQDMLENYSDLVDEYFVLTTQGYQLKDEFADLEANPTAVLEDYAKGQLENYVDSIIDARDAVKEAQDALDNTTVGSTEYLQAVVDLYIANEDLARAEENLQTMESAISTELRQKELDKITDELQDQVDALEDQLDAYQDLIDLRKDLLQTYQDEISYQKELADKTKSVSDLETQLAVAQLDNSAAGLARQRELQSELDSAKEELDEFTLENAIDKVTNQLEKEGDEFEKVINRQTDALETKMDEIASNFRIDVEYEYEDVLDENGKPTGDQQIVGVKSITASYHTGGFVGGEINDNEEFAKLLKGEFVATPAMMQQFMDTTLPGIAEAAAATRNLGGNNFYSPLITLNCEGITTEAIPSMEKIVKRAVSEVEKHIDSGFSRAGRNTRSLNLSL